MREEIIKIFESAGLQEDETSIQMLDEVVKVTQQAHQEGYEEAVEKIRRYMVPTWDENGKEFGKEILIEDWNKITTKNEK